MKLRRRMFLFALPALVVIAAFLATRLGRLSFSAETAEARKTLFAELKPVALENCTLQRVGHAHDGGYLVCGNLLEGVESAYSYGIEGRDDWGCEIATRCKVNVHQYDCFMLIRPPCQGGATVFHEECIGAEASVSDGRRFDTLAAQIAANGDEGKRLVVKMDVEGAEWSSLLSASGQTLERIDQLVLEMHEFDSPKAVEVMRRLKQHFHLAHVHFNNNACTWFTSPFPAWAWEVLFVNRRIAKEDRARKPELPHPLDRKNIPTLPDCQPAW